MKTIFWTMMKKKLSSNRESWPSSMYPCQTTRGTPSIIPMWAEMHLFQTRTSSLRSTMMPSTETCVRSISTRNAMTRSVLSNPNLSLSNLKLARTLFVKFSKRCWIGRRFLGKVLTWIFPREIHRKKIKAELRNQLLEEFHHRSSFLILEWLTSLVEM